MLATWHWNAATAMILLKSDHFLHYLVKYSWIGFFPNTGWTHSCGKVTQSRTWNHWEMVYFLWISWETTYITGNYCKEKQNLTLKFTKSHQDSVLCSICLQCETTITMWHQQEMGEVLKGTKGPPVLNIIWPSQTRKVSTPVRAN